MWLIDGRHVHVGARQVDGDGKPLHYGNGYLGYTNWAGDA